MRVIAALARFNKDARLEALLTSIFLGAVAEIGDKTQLLSFALAARFDALVVVALGATLGMMIANAPAVWIGEKLAQKIPMNSVRIIAASLFIVVGILTIWGPFTTG